MLYVRQAAIAALLFAVSAPPAAIAQDYNWSGFSVYGGGGGLSLDADLAVSDISQYSAKTKCKKIDPQYYYDGPLCLELDLPPGTAKNSGKTSDNDTSFLATVGVGADIEVMRLFVLGAFADIDWSDAEVDLELDASSKFKKSKFLSSATSVDANLEFDYSWTVGGRAGILSINRQALFYVLGGYTEMHANGSASITDAASLFGHPLIGQSFTVGLPDRFSGYTVGVGAEVKLSSAWSLKLEGRFTDLDSESVSYEVSSSKKYDLGTTKKGCGYFYGSPCEAALHTKTSSKGSFDIDPDLWSGRVALTFQLN